MTHLILDQLGMRYDSVHAVRDVSLSLPHGEFLSLLGPSGCGKTTTLRMIAGFVSPTSGRIVLEGNTISSPQGALPPEKRGMSMIFQSYAIWPNMTVAQNVGFGLRMQRLTAGEIRRRTGEILEVVRLSHLAERYPNELSGGQQQRVALARAVVVQPKVLLLDEPLSNLDANLREEMRTEIRRMHNEFRITTVYVTHDQSEAMAISDRIAVMNQGLLEQVDTPYSLYTRPRTRFVAGFIGRTNLIEGRLNGGRVEFAGFNAPVSALAKPVTGPEVLASLRPQSIRLLSEPPQDLGGLVLKGTIVERVFLGETWDYTVVVGEGGVALRAAAPATDVFAINDAAWLAIAPASIVPVEAGAEA